MCQLSWTTIWSLNQDAELLQSCVHLQDSFHVVTLSALTPFAHCCFWRLGLLLRGSEEAGLIFVPNLLCPFLLNPHASCVPEKDNVAS